MRCFGDGRFGKLGYGNESCIGDDELPASVGNVSVRGQGGQISAGLPHTCAVRSAGSVRCWGFEGSGQLGRGNTNNLGDDEPPASAGDISAF